MVSDKVVVDIGPHRLLCGDVTEGAVETLLAGGKADVIYTDPPWGPSLLQGFATMAKRGSSPRLAWPFFLQHVAKVLADSCVEQAPVFVEMGFGPGDAWVDGLDAAMVDHGFERAARWETTYGDKRSRQTVSYFRRPGTPPHVVGLEAGLHGLEPLRALLGQVVRPGVAVLDPFIGLGNTAKVTHRLGGRVLGTELNPARLTRTVDWLKKATGKAPR